MPLIVKNWSLNTYVNSAWTNLVDAGTKIVLVKNVLIACGAVAAEVRVRTVTAGGVVLATLIPSETIDINVGYKLDLSLITLEAGQRLQVWTNVAGVSFSANGAEMT